MSENDLDTRKTVADPILPEEIARFAELQGARVQIAERMLDLEQEKVRTLRAASNVDTERQRLFEKVLMERGLPPNAQVEIDAATGVIKVVNAMSEAAVPAEG